MKYILMMNTMKTGEQPFPGWSQEDVRAHIAFMVALNQELRASGELVSAEGLSSPEEARLVRAGDEWHPGDRRRIPGIQGISRRFLDGQC